VPIPQHVVKDAGGTLSLVFDGGRPTTASLAVKTGDGATIITIADVIASLHACDTTLASAASDGDRTITVASAADISPRDELQLAGLTERARVESISGSIVTLWRPLLNSHASGAAVTVPRFDVSISASQASETWFDGRAEWTLDGALYDVTSCECTIYPFRLAQAALEPQLNKELSRLGAILGRNDDSREVLEDGFAAVLERIGAKDRVRVNIGSAGLQRATVYASIAGIFRARPGDEAERLYTRYDDLVKVEIDRAHGHMPRDENQDGVVTDREKRSRCVRVLRG